MFLHIFALCTVSLYSSLGAPTTKLSATGLTSVTSGSDSPNTTDIAAALDVLASSCGNPLLSSLIKSRLDDCPTKVAPNSEKQFQCMLFYDINRQLCAAVTSSKLTLTEDKTAKIQASLNIEDVCKAGSLWTFTNLGEVYTRTVELVFKDPIRCTKICSADNTDILSVESNYYCKYFKWGSDMLHLIPNTETGAASVPAPKHVLLPDPKDIRHEQGVPLSSSIKSPLDTTNKLTLGNTNTHVPKEAQETAEAELKDVDGKPSSLSNIGENHDDTSVVDHPLLESDPAVQPSVENSNPVVGNSLKDNAISEKDQQINVGVQSGGEIKEELRGNPLKDTNVGEKKVDTSADSNKALQQQKPNDIVESEDYQGDLDSEEGRGLSDTQGGDDGDDPAPLDTEMKPELTQKNNKIEIQQSSDLSQKDYYSNTITDGFPEEDDHFFPFFLTAIIMVILLYVLYHNKSKVSKVIMGLIVEGRQSGRRRNSRGHAYKRLDTLEQAMSTNTAAPPSKIIY